MTIRSLVLGSMLAACSEEALVAREGTNVPDSGVAPPLVDSEAPVETSGCTVVVRDAVKPLLNGGELVFAAGAETLAVHYGDGYGLRQYFVHTLDGEARFAVETPSDCYATVFAGMAGLVLDRPLAYAIPSARERTISLVEWAAPHKVRTFVLPKGKVSDGPTNYYVAVGRKVVFAGRSEPGAVYLAGIDVETGAIGAERGPFQRVVGADSSDRLIVVRDGALIRLALDNTETTITTKPLLAAALDRADDTVVWIENDGSCPTTTTHDLRETRVTGEERIFATVAACGSTGDAEGRFGAQAGYVYSSLGAVIVIRRSDGLMFDGEFEATGRGYTWIQQPLYVDAKDFLTEAVGGYSRHPISSLTPLY